MSTTLHNPSLPLAFALDGLSLVQVQPLAHALRHAVGMLKVGLELFVETGPAAVALGRTNGLPLFLDLKLHDIPETVERAVGRACALGVDLLTVHASGGGAMLARAAKRAEKEGGGTMLAAVTVLTSLQAEDLAQTGVAASPQEHALRLARLAVEHGVRALVCSPHEVRGFRDTFGPDIVLISPGIRSTTDPSFQDDQQRTATPERAIHDGATWLVVGRPIREAPDPLAAAYALAERIQQARQARLLAGGHS